MNPDAIDTAKSVRRCVGCLYVDSIALRRSLAFLVKLTGGDDETKSMLAHAEEMVAWAAAQRATLNLDKEEYPSVHGDPIVWAEHGLRARLARRVRGPP